MGRPIKDGIDYFSLDTTSDRKWKLIRAKYGLFGIGFIVELLKTIYSENYFYPWDDETTLLFADDHNLSPEKVKEIVEFAMDKGFFNRELYKKYYILTSSGIQKRYFEAMWRRKKVVCYREIMLIEPKKPEYSKTEIVYEGFEGFSDIGNGVNVRLKTSETELMQYNNPQSKVKESKVKHINTTAPTAAAEPHNGQVIPFNSGEQKKGLSPLKDDAANYWQSKLTAIQPAETWANYAKERKHCNDLGRKTRALLEITPFENDSELIEAVVKKYLEMRESEKGNYWRAAPVTPSGVITRWDKVTTAIAQEYQEHEAAHEYDAAEAAEFFY